MDDDHERFFLLLKLPITLGASKATLLQQNHLFLDLRRNWQPIELSIASHKLLRQELQFVKQPLEVNIFKISL